MNAIEKEVETYELIKKSIESDRISKRSSDDAKSLTEIIEDFKNTRDAIKTNFEWKFYDIDEFRNRTKDVPIEPKIRNITEPSDPSTNDEQIQQCNCNWEIFSTSMIFGALAIFAYAVLKIFKYKKRIQK